MPVRRRKDISEDLKKAVMAHIKAAMPYRKISALTGLSVGAISAIKKVCKVVSKLCNLGVGIIISVFCKFLLKVVHLFIFSDE